MYASIWKTQGVGLYAGSVHFCVMTITDYRMPREHAVFALSLAVWWVKLEINEKVRYNNIMTQNLMASLIAVVTVFILRLMDF